MNQIVVLLSFWDFVRLGSHQSYGQKNPLAALFFHLFGPLGTHARIRNARLIHTLAGIDLAGKRVLDVGCGHGYTLFWLAEHFSDMRLEGIDTAADQIAGCQRASVARCLSNLHFRPGTPYDLPGQPTYDLLIAIDVLEHLPDDRGPLTAFAPALKPGSYLAVHVPLRHQCKIAFLLHFVPTPSDIAHGTDICLKRLESGWNTLVWKSSASPTALAIGVNFPSS